MKYVGKRYKNTKNKLELKSKYGIDLETIAKKKKEILQIEYDKVKNKNSIALLNNFTAKYQNTEEAKKIKLKRDSLAYERAKQVDNYTAYSSFFDLYTDAKQVPEAKKRYKELWFDIYNAYVADGELKSLKIFENSYPDFPFYGDETRKNKILAVKAFKLQLNKGYLKENDSLYFDYIKHSTGKALNYTVLQRYIEPEILNKKYSEAVKKINELMMYFPNDDRPKKLLKVLKNPQKEISKIGISKNINTDYALEYAATLTADGKTLYFCGMNRSDNKALGNEDVFMSKKNNGKWTTPENIKSINTPELHEAPLSISADGNTMLMYSSSDIYYVNKTKDGWTKKRKFPAINDRKYWEADAMITADGNALLFISDRKGNIGNYHGFSSKFNGSTTGNTDIYVSLKTQTGWSEPENIGDIINTPYGERSPFLHPDMKTMYFSSAGHGSVGKLDVYKTTRLSDTSWTLWSEPENLGTAINTPNDEYDYRISTDGTTAYYSAFSENNADIKVFEIPKNLRPATVTTISGKITDKEKKILTGRIRWEDLETGKTIGFADSDPKTGHYIIVLPNGKNYGFFVDKENYYPASGNVNLIKVAQNKDITQDIVLISVEQMISSGISINIKNLFFEFNKSQIKSESFPELNRLAKFIKSQPNIKIEISGHTDNKGTSDYNKKLSESRAKSVKNYLVKKGCNSQNLTAKGYGDTKPVSTNDTDKGRAENRRVEFKIVK